MKHFFYLHFKEDDGGGVAKSSKERDYDDERRTLPDPAPFRFQLADGPCQDLQANDLGWPLMSSALKSVLEHSVAKELVKWDEAVLVVGDETLNYYVPRFLSDLDVLDEIKSKIVHGPIGDIVMKACLSQSKVRDLNFFPVPGSDIRLIITTALKVQIETKNLTGIDFSEVPTN